MSARLALAALALVALAGGATQEHNSAPTPTPAERIFEDDPRWDCATMGDRWCGAGTPGLNPRWRIGAGTSVYTR